MDIDKVLKGLECHGKGGSKGCIGCPYELTHGCHLILCHDAFALLKEYELYIQHQKDGYAELEAEYNKLLKKQEESVPLKPLCKWLAGYAAPPGQESWLPLYGSLEKAWEHELLRILK